MITCNFEDGGKASLRHVVVHAIIEKDNSLLLVKRTGNILETGKWSLPAGFLDRDETASEGIVREVMEETGWESKVIGLFRINTNPNRPHEDRQNISFDFLVEVIRETGTPDAENSKVEWISIDKLIPFEDFAFDHGESIKLYLAYRKNKFSIPLLV